MAALTGSAVAASVPTVAYGWRCVSIDRTSKVVTFSFEWVEPPQTPKMPPMILSFASSEDVCASNRLYLGPGMTMEVL
jgi:hypothetical protein